MERGVARNLLGRLNARPPGDIARIAERWLVPLRGNDVRRHVGTLYRTMTDIRAARMFYAGLAPVPAAIVRSLALGGGELHTLADIAAQIERPENSTRDGAVSLFNAGILAREGDRQELPIGAIPRVFLPRELEQVFARVLDEIELGDMRHESLRSLFAILDDGDIEAAAQSWAMQVIPGIRGRNELVEELLQRIDDPDRVRRVSATLGRDAQALWVAVRDASESGGGLPWHDALAAAGLLDARETMPTSAAAADLIREVLREVEQCLLVWHSYDNAGERWLFVPHEIRHPGTRLRNLPLEPLTAVPDDEVTPDSNRHPHAVAWDVLTVLRELASHRSPVWQPGEPPARSWQRQVNSRLWTTGDGVPPDGYTGFLLSLAHRVGLIEPDEKPASGGAEKGAFRPRVTDKVRGWRSRSFSAQTGALRDAWREHEAWVEGRERDEIEVWGTAWPAVRATLLAAIGTLELDAWYRHRDLARHLAAQHPDLLGSAFTVASARGGDADGGREGRTARIARVIAIELETAIRWFGLVESGTIEADAGRASVLRLSEAGRLASERPDVVPADDARVPDVPAPDDGTPALTVSDTGEIDLHRPAPLHIWSLSAFCDQVRLGPVPRYEISKPSLGRALAAGFDLDQVVQYLERQSDAPLPERVAMNLREWTAGYRRVRMRRVLELQPDDPAQLHDLATALEREGYQLAERAPDSNTIRVYLPETGDDGAAAEDTLQRSLRANGFAGQWPRPEAGPRRPRD